MNNRGLVPVFWANIPFLGSKPPSQLPLHPSSLPSDSSISLQKCHNQFPVCRQLGFFGHILTSMPQCFHPTLSNRQAYIFLASLLFLEPFLCSFSASSPAPSYLSGDEKTWSNIPSSQVWIPCGSHKIPALSNKELLSSHWNPPPYRDLIRTLDT